MKEYNCVQHGQRVSKLLAGEDFGEEVVVPASDLHFASQTFFERMVFESRDGEASVAGLIWRGNIGDGSIAEV